MFGVLEQKYASLRASGSRPSSVLFRYRLNRYYDGRRTAPPGTGLKLVLHRPHQYVRVPYCSMHVLVESLPESRELESRTPSKNFVPVPSLLPDFLFSILQLDDRDTLLSIHTKKISLCLHVLYSTSYWGKLRPYVRESLGI